MTTTAGLALDHRPRPTGRIQCDEREGRLGHLLADLVVSFAPPGLDVNPHRRAPHRLDRGIERHLVAHLHRAMELHRVHGNRGTATLRRQRRQGARRQVHLAHQPAAEDIARRVGVGGHRHRTNDRLLFRRTRIRRHGRRPKRVCGCPCSAPGSGGRRFPPRSRSCGQRGTP